MQNILMLVAILTALPVIGGLAIWAATHVFVRAISRHALDKQPEHIHLSRADAQDWTHPQAVNEVADPLLFQGFQDAGTYRIDEMQGMVLRLLAHPGESMLAIIYEHPKAGSWLELSTRYENGGDATYLTLKPTGLDTRPGSVTVNAPGTPPLALHAKAMASRPEGAMKPVSVESAVHDFEAGYADSIAWHRSRGVSAREVVNVAEQRKAA